MLMMGDIDVENRGLNILRWTETFESSRSLLARLGPAQELIRDQHTTTPYGALQTCLRGRLFGLDYFVYTSSLPTSAGPRRWMLTAGRHHLHGLCSVPWLSCV